MHFVKEKIKKDRLRFKKGFFILLLGIIFLPFMKKNVYAASYTWLLDAESGYVTNKFNPHVG